MEQLIDWLQVIVPSILVIISGLIGYIIKSRSEELRSIRDKLNSEQRLTYKKLLDPYIKILSDQPEGDGSTAVPLISVSELRKVGFELNLIGSDDVIRAHNQMFQNTYKAERSGGSESRQTAQLFGRLMLEIRKSLGHKNTKLKPKDMLQFMVKDIDKYF